MIGLTQGTVRLTEHQSDWDTAAASAVDLLCTIFGSAAVDIQPIGSTAVRGIQAKPILDIAVAVRHLSEVSAWIPRLEQAGFIHRPENDSSGHLFFSVGEGGIRTCHLHVVTVDGQAWRDYLLFRDYLNAKPAIAKEYEALKLRLAAQFPTDRSAYTEGKAGLIAQTLTQALAWSYLGRIVTLLPDENFSQAAGDMCFGVVTDAVGHEKLPVCMLAERAKLPCPARIVAVAYHMAGRPMLIAAAPDLRLHQAEVLALLQRNTSFADSDMDYFYHKSCGALIYKWVKGELRYLILFQHGSKTWSLPKGHIESGESERQTAAREVLEETGLTVTLHTDFRETVFYRTAAVSEKQVVVFLAEKKGTLAVRAEEIERFVWADQAQAAQLLPQAGYDRILKKAACLINSQ